MSERSMFWLAAAARFAAVAALGVAFVAGPLEQQGCA